ncbi:MAG TPA: hypothetical protein VE439_09180 [Anaerolineae bacterium]|nr:hypothetical protein [Anaerolineae bacterium]
MFDIRKAGIYDFALALATITILVALSAIFAYGTIESWANSVRDPGWTSSWLYTDYLGMMNSYAYPFVVALVLILCMCIPKRFIPRGYLLQSSVILLALSLMIGIIWGFAVGLGFLLVVSAIIQAAVVVMVIARSKRLVFEREGIMVQFGSSLLHLGFVVFILDLVLIKDLQNHLSVFWISTALIIAGTIFSFYSRELLLAMRNITGRKERAITDMELDREHDGMPGVAGIPADSTPAYEIED